MMERFEAHHFDRIVYDNEMYIIGHAEVTKEKCEIYNFVSPTFRMLHFLEGTVEWKIDREIYTFYPGDVIIFSNLIKRNIHRVLTGNITYEFFDFYPFLLSNETLRNFFYGRIYKVASNTDQAARNIYYLLDSLKREMKKENDSFKIFSIQHYLDLLVLEFYRNNKFSEIPANSSLKSIIKSIQYIRNNLTKDLRVTKLADICGYSPEYFTRVFKKIMGISPKSYIINLRIERVLHQVSTSNITILDAALESGFRSSSAFYKAFNAHKAKSPLQYKKLIHLA
jgi:AraC-like DNA-binding protein